MTADIDRVVKHLLDFRRFAVATCILLFIAAIAFSYEVGLSRDALDRVIQYDWSNSAFQGRNEAAELERRVTQLALGGDPSSLKSAVRWQQILLSRVRSWGNSDFGQFIGEDPRLVGQYGTLVADMDSLGNTLLRMGDERVPGDDFERTAISGVIELARAIKRSVDRLGMHAYAHNLSEMAKARDDLHSKQTAQIILNVFLFAIVLILLLVAIRQNRILALANAAIVGGARQLAESEARLSGVLENTTDGVVVLDVHFHVTFANQKASRMIAELRLGISAWDLFPKIVGTDVQQNFVRAMEQQTPMDFEVPFRNSWLEIHAFPTPDNLSVFFRDVTERRRVNDQLVHMARHDPLTNLANRTLFEERLLLGLDCGRQRCELTLILIDLDDFKLVNDLRGHQVGDRLLEEVADRLVSLVRPEDTVARLGGDEFAIIQPRPAAPDGGASIALRISEALRAPFDIDGSQVTVGASIGIAMAPEHGSQPEDLIHNADLALYRAKETKGTSLSHCVFEPAIEHRQEARQLHRLELQRVGHARAPARPN